MYKLRFYQILNQHLQLSDMPAERQAAIQQYIYELAVLDFRQNFRTLITENNIADAIYFLLEGSCKFFCYSPFHNQEIIPFLLQSPCILAEGRSLRAMEGARFGIEVSAGSVVYSLNKAAITRIEDRYPEISAKIDLLIKTQNDDFDLWQQNLYRESATTRYQRLCSTRPHIIKYSLKKNIAAHLGIKDPSFSRLLRRLGDKPSFF